MPSGTEAGSSPLSAPIWTMSARMRRAGPVISSQRLKKRESAPFTIRKRYFRGSTSSTGQTTPFTTMALPKNSGPEENIGFPSRVDRLRPV